MGVPGFRSRGISSSFGARFSTIERQAMRFSSKLRGLDRILLFPNRSRGGIVRQVLLLCQLPLSGEDGESAAGRRELELVYEELLDG
jgi:hypothetical protein